MSDCTNVFGHSLQANPTGEIPNALRETRESSLPRFYSKHPVCECVVSLKKKKKTMKWPKVMSTPWLVIGLKSAWFCFSHLSVAQLTADSTLARQQEEKLSGNIELFWDLRPFLLSESILYCQVLWYVIVYLQRECWLLLVLSASLLLPKSSPPLPQWTSFWASLCHSTGLVPRSCCHGREWRSILLPTHAIIRGKLEKKLEKNLLLMLSLQAINRLWIFILL